MTIWIIYQKGEPIAAIADEAEAKREMEYLTYHGDGYKLKPLPLESNAGKYATRVS